MLLFLLSYLGGALTIVSPCILPVLPFVFARADRPFARNGLPMLLGMAATFAAVATLAAVGGGWAVDANQYGRLAAIALLALFGLTLLLPGLSERMTRPLVALGARLSQTARQDTGKSASSLWSPLLLGVATGLLWAPCAGPILGLILTGAALKGANAQTSVLLFAYAAGSATSLALALLVGGKFFAAMKRSLHASEWIRRGLGVAVLVGVIAIAFGLDTGFLTNLSVASTTSLEQTLLDRLHPTRMAAETEPQSSPLMSGDSTVMTGGPAMMMMKPRAPKDAASLPVEGVLPSLSGAVEWLNSPPLTAKDLHGKVVLVDFWTYSCINCLRAIPYVRAWAEKYRDQGLIVIGVHAPEFAFERNPDNVRKAVTELKIGYPVALDNSYAIWRAFNNEYWPAHYFIDAEGRIRHHHFGEGDYEESERVIQQLLSEAGNTELDGIVSVRGSGVEAAADLDDIQSPETYVGYERAHNFISRGGATQNAPKDYLIATPRLNEWGFSGNWTVGPEYAHLNAVDGAIVYRFHARDLHLVLGPATGGKAVRFLVTLDGAAPGAEHGTDVGPDGQGVVADERVYQLIRQSGAIADHTFQIRFLDPGVQAYAFTFG
jgi:cytochrome c biogenesis protein CcdA/thiol-disulfide isomerase/thioredoxin